MNRMNTNFCFLLSFLLFNLLLSCRPSTNTKKENLDNKQKVGDTISLTSLRDTISLVYVESKLDSFSIRNITEVNTLPLPFGDSSTLEFATVPFNTLIIPKERNVKLEKNIYSFNYYYSSSMTRKFMDTEIVPLFDSSWLPFLFYYDVEINSKSITIANDSVVVLKKIELPNQIVYLAYSDLKPTLKQMTHETYNLYSYGIEIN